MKDTPIWICVGLLLIVLIFGISVNTKLNNLQSSVYRVQDQVTEVKNQTSPIKTESFFKQMTSTSSDPVSRYYNDPAYKAQVDAAVNDVYRQAGIDRKIGDPQ